MSLGAAFGPANDAAAMLMGNTVPTWQKHYDARYRSREAQAGVDAMADWRKEMLQRAGMTAPSTAVPVTGRVAPEHDHVVYEPADVSESEASLSDRCTSESDAKMSMCNSDSESVSDADFAEE